MTSIFKNRDTLLNCEARAQLTQNLLFFRQKEKLEGDQAWIHHERQLIEVEKSACRAKPCIQIAVFTKLFVVFTIIVYYYE